MNRQKKVVKQLPVFINACRHLHRQTDELTAGQTFNNHLKPLAATIVILLQFGNENV